MKIRPVIITNQVDILPMQVVVDEFLNGLRDRPSTHRAYASDLARFFEFVNPSPVLAEFNQGSVVAFVAEERKHVSPRTLERRIACYKSFSRHIAERHQVSDRLRELSIPISADREPFKGLTEEEYRRLLVELRTCQLTHRVMVLLMLHTGLRISEVCSLRLGNIGDGQLVRVKGKGNKYRRVALPIPPLLQDTLNEYLLIRNGRLTRPEYPVFLSNRGSVQRSPTSYRYDVKTLYRIVIDIFGRAGIKGTPHTLRHTFAIRALKHLSPILGAGQALVEVSKMLGHSSIQTTMIYLTLERTQLHSVMGSFK